MANQAIANLERLTTRTFVGASALLLVSPWLTLPWLSPPLILVIITLLALPIAWATYYRTKLAKLPLVLAPLALKTSEADTVVYQFQTWLGRGRTMRHPRVQVSFRPDGAEAVSLKAIIPCQVLCGPWTIMAPDTEKLCARPGVFLVQLQVQEGSQTWEAQGQWESQAIEVGRFQVGFKQVRRRIQWDHNAWGQRRPVSGK